MSTIDDIAAVLGTYKRSNYHRQRDEYKLKLIQYDIESVVQELEALKAWKASLNKITIEGVVYDCG